MKFDDSRDALVSGDQARLEQTEDALDLVVWEDAKREFDANPETSPADEISAKYL